mmetsp:Transcript_72449/g.120779  ORF Transcript_72449/g.120779 Transcript_72449/m.120779 type:complete len:215 (+) Transcript_72449:622-1266(+)
MRKTASGIRPKYHMDSVHSFNRGAIVSDTIDMSLIRIFRAGPDVSLKGSPTVSPTTQAFCCAFSGESSGIFFSPSFSQSFFELSHAPPALAIIMASMQPDAMAPASSPSKNAGPTRKPAMRGARTAYVPGATISRTDCFVEISTHFSESGFTSSASEAFHMPSPSSSYFWVYILMHSPSVTPALFVSSRNWRRTSVMISAAALPTEIMVRAANR